MSNIELFEQLRCAGSRLDAPHSLEHDVVGPVSGLDILRRELEANGFRSTASTGEHLTLQKPADLEAESPSKLTVALSRFAREVGARYDGWGAPVVR